MLSSSMQNQIILIFLCGDGVIKMTPQPRNINWEFLQAHRGLKPIPACFAREARNTQDRSCLSNQTINVKPITSNLLLIKVVD